MIFKLSIITINLNNRPGLEKTIQSIVSQDNKDFEIFVIDGDSNDGSDKVIQRNKNHIDKYIIEKDNGIFHAMNKGINLATGEYCLFLNSGDRLYDSSTISKVLSMDLKEDIIYGLQYIKKNGELIEDTCLDVPYITFRTLRKSHIPHQATFIKRSLFNKIGHYSEENKIVSDWEFIMLAIFKHDCTIKRIYVPINVYDTTGISSLTEYKHLQDIERERSLNKHFPLINQDYIYFEKFLQKRYIKCILTIRNFYNRLRKHFK